MIMQQNGYAWEVTAKDIGVYLPGGEGWFRYPLRRIVKPYTDGGTHQNQDLWRLHQVTLWNREGDGFSPIYPFPITNGGEWECAIRIEGTPDFHGGFHGYEHATSFEIFPEKDSFGAVQESVIYLQGTRDTRVATHRKEYLFSDGELVLKQRVVWEMACHVNRAFLTMLPIRRREGDFLINDTALYEGKEYDISAEGHKTPLSPGCKFDINEITTTGKQSGITATVRASYGKDFAIQNTSQYNKLYFCYARNYHTEVDEVWEAESLFRLQYQKPAK
ncbi:MAG: hypothetical protein IKC69_04835 [Clostridia bacterium]|nr:hypothetical protein [Clostridia bacterium]